MAAMPRRRPAPQERRDLATRSVCDALAISIDVHPSSLAPLDRGVVLKLAAQIGLRAGPADDGPGAVEAGWLHVDLAARTVHIGDESVHLKVREYDLLVLLAQNPGRVVLRDQLPASIN